MQDLFSYVNYFPKYPFTSRCLLMIHAHPDDESIFTGATASFYSNKGVRVVLLVCTRGESGKILKKSKTLKNYKISNYNFNEYRKLVAKVRLNELKKATNILGITEYYFLGEQSICNPCIGSKVYEDSGMTWKPNKQEATFSNKMLKIYKKKSNKNTFFSFVPLQEIVDQIAWAICCIKPNIVLCYDPFGSYGHPDHKRIYQATMMAVNTLNLKNKLTKHDKNCKCIKKLNTWKVDNLFAIKSYDYIYKNNCLNHKHLNTINIVGNLYKKIQAIETYKSQLIISKDNKNYKSNNIKKNETLYYSLKKNYLIRINEKEKFIILV